MDLALGDDGDLDLSSGGLALIDGDDALVQHLALRFKLVKGECFLDPDVGVPYFQSVLVKNPDLVAIQSIFRRVILTTPGITEITAFAFAFDASTRRAQLTFTALDQDSNPISFDQEFVIA